MISGCAESGDKGSAVHQWGVYETAFESSRGYEDPLRDAEVTVDFTSPSGGTRTVEAFWDGERTWRVRFSPEETGSWTWRTVCSDRANQGLHDRRGRFECLAYAADNPLYQHGPVKLSESRRHLVHADGAPFFWLADTAWNGVLRPKPEDWHQYLQTRSQQKFTAIQFVTTQWRGGREVLPDRAYSTEPHFTVHPAFFQRLDPMVAAINEHHLVAAPVVLWGNQKDDPGQALPPEDAILLARYIVARWGAHQVVWLLGGDGHYEGESVERWRQIGRAVFADRHDRLVTLHPRGRSWVGDEYAGEPWFDFIGYQSGHGGSDEHLRWLVQGPPARAWRELPPLPVLNLEPNYENHPAYQTGERFTGYHVRRAAYWSLLAAPAAGLTYGHNSIWVWNETAGPAEGHERIGVVEPWRQGLESEGLRGMTILRHYFESKPWTHLRPAPEIVARQPGEQEPARFIAAASTEDGSWAVVYTPLGGPLQLETSALKRPANARWFDPRTGEFMDVGVVEGERFAAKAPDEQDWVLDIRAQ